MIISVSRRTDIPALYSSWFMNRIHEGWCTVPSPFNARHVSRIALTPADVDALVFWTRNPLPMLPFLAELKKNFRFYFQVTLLDESRELCPGCGPLESRIHALKKLSAVIGPNRIVWRYDPIYLCARTPENFYYQTFERLAKLLAGHVRHCVISFFAPYVKVLHRIHQQKVIEISPQPVTRSQLQHIGENFAQIAHSYALSLKWCCPPERLVLPRSVQQGSCIDREILRDMAVTVSDKKDAGQRPGCGCAPSRDIGMYNTCVHGCLYCYATHSHSGALARYRRHDPHSPSLFGHYMPQQKTDQYTLF